ncbi:hypothetical protein [Gemmatimonas sp.]
MELDPEHSVAAVAAGQSSLKAFAESAVAYLATVLMTWLLSRLLVGRRLTKLETKHATDLAELEERLMEKFSTLSHDHAALAQEVWGAQQQNGLRGEVEKVKTMQQRHGETLASIKAMLELLIKQQS